MSELEMSQEEKVMVNLEIVQVLSGIRLHNSNSLIYIKIEEIISSVLDQIKPL